MTFHALSPQEIICMKCLSLFSRKNKKKIYIISLLSAELAQRVANVDLGPAEPGYALLLQTV